MTINNMKSRLIASSCALAAALLAFTFAFGSAPASAEKSLETISCSLQTDALDYSVELAEEIDVLCLPAAAESQAVETANVDLGTPAEVDTPPSAVIETQQPAADEAATSVSVGGPVGRRGTSHPGRNHPVRYRRGAGSSRR